MMNTSLTTEELEEIVTGAGEKTKWYFSWRFPFAYKTTWIFGGHCGVCGRWNWQWAEVGLMIVTAPCNECQTMK